MQFVHQILTWGFLLALVPLLIHLINMMRHKRVEWAAMEFLLASYKKHRKWIWLKQFLLLLARMAVIALVVAMLAQLKTRDQWLAIFGGRVTHHYVLLDDSYSMSDRVAGASAMDAAKQVLASIVGRAGQEDSPQRLTLIRYSQARAEQTAAADFNAEPIDANFDVALERRIRTFDASQLSVGPEGALGVLKQLLGQTKDETSIVYLLSDFRAKDWSAPAEIRESLAQLRRSQAELHLVNCARSTEPNLGIVAIEPAAETRAAGVPLFINVQVKNFGARAASKVQLKLRSMFYAPENLAQVAPDQLRGESEDLATLLIEEIGPGETIDRRVQVYFPQPGKHVVEATLPEDPVETDNHHWCVIDFPDGERVLVIDGSTEQQHAYFLEVAFRPLQRSNTGVRPEVKPVSFLRDATLETLNQYASIYLLDVGRLDGKGAEALEAYVKSGGGVAIFAGPEASHDYYNQALYKDGQGLLPAPLGLPADLSPALDPSEPDIELRSHPIFSFFLSETNPLIRGVKLSTYRQVAEGWKPTSETATEILATTRDGSPLVISKKHGAGEVLLFLTTLAPDWNDWAKNPSFVVVALKLQSYLAASRRSDDSRSVGAPIDLQLPATGYRPDVAFVMPGERPSSRQKLDQRAAAPSSADAKAADAGEMLVASLGRTTIDGRPRGDTDRPGIYEAWPLTLKGEIDLRRWALNVDPLEGDLTQVPPADLSARLDPVKINYHLADQYEQSEVASSGYNLSMLLLAALVLLLLGEQLLAYSASYHVVSGAAS